MQCLMDHIVLNVEDDEKMVDFYTEVLQLEPERLEEYREGEVPFPSVRLGPDTVIDLFPKRMWEKNATVGKGRKYLNHFCLSMTKEAWDALEKRLRTGNIEIEEGPVPRWGAYGTGTSIYFRDPEGNIIEARYYEKKSGTDKCFLGS